jgi:hypothetical protein
MHALAILFPLKPLFVGGSGSRTKLFGRGIHAVPKFVRPTSGLRLHVSFLYVAQSVLEQVSFYISGEVSSYCFKGPACTGLRDQTKCFIEKGSGRKLLVLTSGYILTVQAVGPKEPWTKTAAR